MSTKPSENDVLSGRRPWLSRLENSRSLIDPTLLTDAQQRETPPVPHAVVRINPVNGRKNFYAGAHASHIRGWPVEEGRALLRELTAFVAQPQYTYTHKWRDNDLVIWDNRCALHRRDRLDPRLRRLMHRTQVRDEARPVAAWAD